MSRRLLVAALGTLAGCGPATRDSSAPAVPRWRLEPIVTLAGPRDTGWTRLKDVVADARGAIYVLDEGAAQIRVFDSAGAARRVIGRKGAGPAEFGEAYGMGIGWLGDTLAVLDPGNGRLARITPSGEWVGSWPARRITGRDVRLRQAGHAVYAPDMRPAGAKLHALLVRYSASGAGDTLVLPDRPADPPGAIVCPAAGAIRFFTIPFAYGILSVPGPGGELVTARTDAYRIAVVSTRGDTLRVISRDVAPVPVSDSEWAAGLAEYGEFRAKNPGASCDPLSPTRVRLKPVLRNLVFDDAGNLWVERRSKEGDVLDVFDGAGKLIGTLPAPAHDADIPFYVRRDRLYTITVDEATGAQAVNAYRVVQPHVAGAGSAR
jgi:hypothetical protein